MKRGSTRVDFDTLVAPLAGTSAVGTDLRYSATYDKIRVLRRTADNKLTGKHEQETQSGPGPEQEWTAIEKLASDALARQSKDLQLAVWLLDVWTRLDGFGGVALGVRLIRELIERYWDSLYPSIDQDEDEPLAVRLGVVEWVDDKLPSVLKLLPLTSSQTGEYALLHYDVTQKTGAEKQALIEAGWPSGEAFDRALTDSGLPHLKPLLEQIVACQEQIGLLSTAAEPRFVARRKTPDGSERVEQLVGFGRTSEALETCRWLVARAIDKVQPGDVTNAESSAESTAEALEPVVVAGDQIAASRSVGAPPVAIDGRDGALARIRQAAAFLLKDDPTDATAYVLDRAIAFGPLFARDEMPDAPGIVSPPTEVRARLRALAAGESWPELIDEAEAFLRANSPQPWIDLQRYVVTALEHLGGSSANAAQTVEHLLRALLATLPGLVDAEFADGTPLANQESHRWLRDRGIAGAPATVTVLPTPPAARVDDPPAVESPISPSAAAGEEARALVRAGHASEGLALLQDRIGGSRSGRDRFLLKLEMGEVCLDTDRAALAYPILDELTTTIDRVRLEEWEDKDLVARVWMAMVRCCRQLDGAPDVQARGKEVFARLCRLDISKALSIDKDAPAAAARWFKR